MDYLHWIDLLGVAVFAISGTLMAYEKHLDGFGVVVLASVTAIGGGTLRDMMLDQRRVVVFRCSKLLRDKINNS